MLTSVGDQGITIVYNDVEQTHSGIEGEFTWYPSSRLRLKGMASLGDWKFSKNFNGSSFYNDNGQSAGETGTLYLDGVKIGDAAQTTMYLGATYKLSLPQYHYVFVQHRCKQLLSLGHQLT